MTKLDYVLNVFGEATVEVNRFSEYIPINVQIALRDTVYTFHLV